MKKRVFIETSEIESIDSVRVPRAKTEWKDEVVPVEEANHLYVFTFKELADFLYDYDWDAVGDPEAFILNYKNK